MTIETKFGIGDVVYFMACDKIRKGTVADILVDSFLDKEISYKVVGGNSLGTWEENHVEKKLFTTIDELIDDLRLTWTEGLL